MEENTIMDEIVTLYITGVASGIIVSVIPFVVGEMINLSLKIMKGGQ